MGIYFTNDSLITDSAFVYHVNPQIANDSLNVITDTVSWVKISGTFNATGGERFFTFGNFKYNNQTNYIHINDYVYGYSYYLLDDVAVYECDAPVFTAQAGNDTTLCKGASVRLGMPRYNEYLYKWYTVDGVLIDTANYITVSPTTTTSYVLKLEDFKYDFSYDTLTISINDNCDKQTVYIPNIFSPNGDGANDIFRVRGPNIDSVHLQVYNRWGNLVFESKDINAGWDGTYKGQDCEAGVYAFWATINFTNGQTIVKSGNVTLIR
ncbi:MAG: gliding motility-associated C-terminal domain-containing protein [Bacteroidota bacterium]